MAKAVPVVRVRGGLPEEGGPQNASVGGNHLARHDDESAQAFEARARAAMRDARAPFLVIGGLPE